MYMYVCIYICIYYISGHKLSTTHSVHIENNVASRLSQQWICGNSCTWAHDKQCCYRTSCAQVHELPHHRTTVVTGRAHCFHDCIYIYIYIYIYK